MQRSVCHIVPWVISLLILIAPSVRVEGAWTLDKVSLAVVFLSHGTGILILHDARPVLVTAEHVAKTLTPDTSVTLRGDGDRPIKLMLGRMAGAKEALVWCPHGREDVNVLPLSPEHDVLIQLHKHFLPANLLVAELEAPSRAITLTVMGFPLGLGSQGHFSPITRETKPASGLITLPRFDTQKPGTFFLTQDPSIGGFSGGPVFDTGLPYREDKVLLKITAGKFKLVGLVHGTISDKTGGKLGAVVPSSFIFETIEKCIRTYQ